MSIEPLRSQFADDADMAELLVEFVTGLTGTCEKLENALAAGDTESVKRVGHQLKGAGGGYGYPDITTAGANLENSVVAAGAINETVVANAKNLIHVCHRAAAGVAAS